ncbi:uncharacterized protein BO95DRAFT_102236 [Aspergillus brunneoviolaceus CBS 621.78]|uniref:Uncharacterized protein n=1 Tax=Aspergillus brunneoviolaceus CBS 621.78 TaxID=1450534 RepID=A0ACD1GB96_9EURO|nr:hypothetical protein BO95DRAFT_102236 [Aspergillus brunneoviolaceus CBS 621.78]RAH46487.1 hypothetical protein BO95DRAFT_102236 [Aspergillus brunneoviolaceus CBS 621.78]
MWNGIQPLPLWRCEIVSPNVDRCSRTVLSRLATYCKRPCRPSGTGLGMNGVGWESHMRMRVLQGPPRFRLVRIQLGGSWIIQAVSRLAFQEDLSVRCTHVCMYLGNVCGLAYYLLLRHAPTQMRNATGLFPISLSSFKRAPASDQTQSTRWYPRATTHLQPLDTTSKTTRPQIECWCERGGFCFRCLFEHAMGDLRACAILSAHASCSVMTA